MRKIEPIVLSIADTSKLLSLSRATVTRRIADGTLECIRIGTTIRVRMDSIDAILTGKQLSEGARP